MPKRSTTTFTSEDAPADKETPLHVYYCKYSGEHLLITDAKLSELPRRRTDGALILDTQASVVRLKAAQQAPKLVKRAEGSLEKQFRYHTSANLLFAYRTEPAGRHLYILCDSLTSWGGDAQVDEAAGAAGASVPLPPCIQRVRAGVSASAGGAPSSEAAPQVQVQVALAIEERSRSSAVLRISADDVRVSVTGSASASADELMQMLGRVLGVRLAQLRLDKGWNDTSRMALVTGMPAEEVHSRLRAAAGAEAERAARAYAGAAMQD